MRNNRSRLICVGLIVMVMGAWCCQPVYVLSVKDLCTGAKLFAARVSPGEEIVDVHNHSVYGSPVYHIREISEHCEFIVKSVRSSPTVLFSRYPGYGLEGQNCIEPPGNGDGLVEVRIDRKVERITLAVGDEQTNTRLILRGQQVPLTDVSACKVVVCDLTKTRLFCYLLGSCP